MASQTAMENMNACQNSWPTDHALFEAAKLKVPEQAKKLDDLLERTEQVMREKDLLDHRVGQILGLEVMVAHEWPTDRALFITAIVKANSLENYDINTELQGRWALVKQGMAYKIMLDELIVEVLELQMQSETLQNVLAESGAFEHDYEKNGFFTESDIEEMQKERENFETKAQWTEEEYKAHCLPKNAGPYDHLTEEDWNEYEKSHRDSGCEGDQTNGGSGVLLCKVPLVSPITVPQELSIAEDDGWVKDLVRLVAESKAIREAPLSAFADLAALEDDDTIPEVDIEAA